MADLNPMVSWVAPSFGNIPADLKTERWAVWKAEPREGNPGKFNKAPRNPHSGGKIGANNPNAFGTYKEAITAYNAGGWTGVGVLLTGNGIVGVDLDNTEELFRARPDVKAWLDKAVQRKDTDVYAETSPSGTGLRLFVRGTLPESKGRHCDSLEIYTTGRFLTVTGASYPADMQPITSIPHNQAIVDAFLELLPAVVQTTITSAVVATSNQIANPVDIESISEIVKTYVPHLWIGDWQSCGKYPSQSEADFAVCGRLVREAIGAGVAHDELQDAVFQAFKQCGLYRKEKDRQIKDIAIPKLVAQVLEEQSLGITMSNLLGYKAPGVTALNVASSDKGFFDDLTLREEDVKKMAEAEFLIPDMIVRGHVAAYVAPGNGGKTTIFIYLCEQLVKLGLEVFYINVDGSPGDLKRHFAHSAIHGYRVIAPDARDGKSPADVLGKLREMAKSNADLANQVFIFDTLKKFVDVIDKRMAKELYQLFRNLTVKGATICLLGHTNKYNDAEGNAIYEGTADLRNDLDELIYLDVYKNEANNTLEVTTRPDKVRAEFSPKSYVIDLSDRSVTEPAGVIKILTKVDRDILDIIKEAIIAGNHSQKDIINHVKVKCTHSDKKIRSSLLFHSRGHLPEITVVMAGRAKDLHYGLPSNNLFQSKLGVK